MRRSFVDSLCFEAEKNPDIWLLTADLGYSYLEKFAELFPDRFVNVGVAEQNMIGIASGLALSGKKVFVYSITNFLTLRCFEHIRNDVVYHNLDVNIVGVGGGFSYGNAGYTHHGIEDINLMSSLPTLKVFAPSTADEIEVDMKEMIRDKSPSYLRLDKCSSKRYNLAIESAYDSAVLKEGKEVLVLGYGSIVSHLVENITQGVRIVSINCIHPLNEKRILELAKGFNKIVLVEEHIESIVSLKLEQILQKDCFSRTIKKHYIKDPIVSYSGSKDFLRKKNELSELDINKSLENLMTII